MRLALFISLASLALLASGASARADAPATAAGASAPAALAHGDAPFRHLSFAEALAAAGAERKPVLALVSAEWCSSCKELEMKTLSRGDVKGFLAQRFVAIEIDGEKGEGRTLVKRYHVVGFPTILVLSATGEEIDRIFGSEEAEPFVKALTGYLHGSGTLADLERRFALRPDDLPLKADLGMRLAIRGIRERAAILLAEVVIADRENRAGLASKALVTMGKYLFLRGQNDPALALPVLEALVTHFPKSPEAKEAPMAIAICHARLGDEAKAQAILREKIARAPADGYNALGWYYFREKKELAQAVATIREGLDRAPRDDGLWDSYAEFLHLAGRRDEARRAAETALSLKPTDPYYRYQVQRFGLARR